MPLWRLAAFDGRLIGFVDDPREEAAKSATNKMRIVRKWRHGTKARGLYRRRCRAVTCPATC